MSTTQARVLDKIVPEEKVVDNTGQLSSPKIFVEESMYVYLTDEILDP